jgi:hypothetical protein
MTSLPSAILVYTAATLLEAFLEEEICANCILVKANP